MDSPKIRARGAGTINLADETLDVVINPQRKRAFFNRRSAVRINGSLRNPSAFTLTLQKISYRRVGCAHQIALNIAAEGGHSPPYTET